MESIIEFINKNKDSCKFIEIFNQLSTKYLDQDIRLAFLLEYDYDIDDDINNYNSQTVETRSYQQKLRYHALIRYNNKCVISGIDRVRCLEACHIRQVFKCDNNTEKADINNVLLLWIDIHKYFDIYQISINPTTRRVVVNLDNEENYWMKQYDGIKLDLSNETLEYIKDHYEDYLKLKTK